MKKYSLIIVAAIAFISCNENGNAEGSKETPAETTTPATATAAKIKDPVCGMEMDGEHWTEMSVNGTDTTWFCSPHCKGQYEKDPAKYQKPAPAKS